MSETRSCSPSVKNLWQYKALGDVCVTSSGGTPLKLDSANYDGGTIPWLMSGEVGQRDVIAATKFITDKGLANSSAKLFPPSSVLVAMYGATAGEVGILRFKAATNQAVCGILPNEDFVPEFLYYFLLARQQELASTATGNAQPNISQAKIRALQIPIMPRKEQERLVSILDEAFEGIARAKRNAEQNFLNAQSIFDDSVRALITSEDLDWPLQTLGQICQVERGSSPRPIKNYFTTASDGVNWIKIGDTVEGEKYIHTTKQRITAEGAKQSRFVQEGDFVLTNSMSFGRSYIMKTSGYIHDGWFVLRLKSSIDRDYLYYLLTSKYIRDQFNELASGSVVLNISGDLVKRAKLPVPPIKEQLDLVGRLDTLAAETKNLQAIYERKIMALDALKQSLLNAAFSGNL